jgi:hypothetical protein
VNNYKSYTGSLFLASFLIIAFLSILKRYTASLIGSSNLTPSGLIANTELNVIMTPGKDLQYLEHWFDNLWEKEDFEKLKITEVIASAIDSSKFHKRIQETFVYVNSRLFQASCKIHECKLFIRRLEILGFQLFDIAQV